MDRAYHSPPGLETPDPAPFDRAEAQVLATLYALETRVEEWWGGRRGRLDRRQLREHARRFWNHEWGAALEPWEGVLERLEARGLVIEERGELRLSALGREPARELRDAFRRQRFDAVLAQAEASEAYRTFCRRTGDLDLRVFSPLDRAQLTQVIDALDLQPTERWLDAGCGAGHVTEAIARRTRTRALGVDQAEGAIRLARRRTEGNADLAFETWDFTRDPSADPSALESRAFDAVLALDSLAFVDDLEAALAHLIGRLAPGARLVALTLETAPRLEEAPAARALAALGLRFEQRDLSRDFEPLLRARAFAVRALRGAFRREGHDLLAGMLTLEVERLLPLLEAGRLRRHLYRVEAG